MPLKLTSDLFTRYHLDLATEDWLRKLNAHVTSSIASHPEYQGANGTGTITSRYNEDRFMGPLSLVKNEFVATVVVSRRLSLRKDRYKATVRYDSETGSFETFNEEVSTVETKARDRKNFAQVKKLAKSIKRGCLRQVVDGWRCPWCESAISVSFHRRGQAFAVSCPNGHFHWHASTTTPPDWWREAVTDGWLD